MAKIPSKLLETKKLLNTYRTTVREYIDAQDEIIEAIEERQQRSALSDIRTKISRLMK